MVVAIDGPAGVGKSSLAKRISDHFGFFNLNSGSFYRAVALKALDAGISETDERAIVRAAETARLQIIGGRLHLEGRDSESRLRGDRVDRFSSIVSAIVPVRHSVNRHIRGLAEGMDIVAEGRDMTTVVFPEAEVKIYLDATPELRAKRRFGQGTSGLSLQEIENSIRERDHRDRNKEEGSLRIAAGAKVVDTSDLTLNEVYEKVVGLIKTHL